LTGSELKERLVDTIALLSIAGVGRGRFNRLVAAFGSPAEALSASIDDLETTDGISRTIAGQIKDGYDGQKARQTAARIVQLGWAVLFPDHPEYPQALLTIADYPPLLFRLGEPFKSEDKSIAIVGTRHCTEKGRLFTLELGRSLARAGIIVISGMAEGIDSAAHAGALEEGGRTVAVWGNSLDIVYPPANKGLAAKIMANGAAYSEYLPGTNPDRSTFPDRNRLISGLADGVVVVEAGRKSGALITAQHALEQGRELFAVPGSPHAHMSEGTNALIKKGARLITGLDDIFEELPRLKGEVISKKFRQMPDMTETEKSIVSLFSDGCLQIDQIARDVQIPVPELMGFLLALEMKGVIRELSGKRFALCETFI